MLCLLFLIKMFKNTRQSPIKTSKVQLVRVCMLQSKFRIGQIVIHNKQRYSGVIIDVDPSFQPRGVSAPSVLKKNIAAEYPWYRILVNNTNQITYVKEPLLMPDSQTYPICHPDLLDYLKEENGQYKGQYDIN